MAQQASAPKYQILEYKYVPDVLEKRGPYREQHIGAAKKLEEEGKVTIAGAFGSPPEGALFVFKGMSEDEIKNFVENDPYFLNGLVTEWKIKPYAVVIGDS